MAGSTKTAKLLRNKVAFAPSTKHIVSATSLRQVTCASADPRSLQEYKASDPPRRISTTSPLSIMPMSSVLRSLAINSLSSSTVLLAPLLRVLSFIAHTSSPILSPDTNPVLKFFLKRTFYRQFCAGESPAEVKQTIDGLKKIGFKGVILGYAREVVMTDHHIQKLALGKELTMGSCIQDEIIPWADGTLETVRLSGPNDFVALKFTGAGNQALYDLTRQTGPSPALAKAIDSICELAVSRRVRLLFDAEQQSVQPGIDAWTLKYMRKYNKRENERVVVYGTYQAYLKATPSVISKHLAIAKKEGFSLGIKLVRGAYLGSDPRHLIHDTKADTDAAYDGIAESLLRKSYGSTLKLAAGENDSQFPEVNLVLAGHNQLSVRKVQAIRNAQSQVGDFQIDLVYAQLQGMADEVSCELIQAGKVKSKLNVDIPKAYKYLVWGTTGECMKYLLRRAEENRDAMQRTKVGRDAMASELFRRLKGFFGLSP